MMTSKWWKIAGWVLSILIALPLLMGATMMLMASEDTMKQISAYGLQYHVRLIGVGALISVLLFLIPITHPLGVLLLSSYMGGAILVHMSHGESYLFASVFLILIWTAGFLRRPTLLIDERKPVLPVDQIS